MPLSQPSPIELDNGEYGLVFILIKNNLRSALSQWTDWIAYCPEFGEASTESSVRWRDCLDENGTQIELYHCTFRSKLPSIESQNDAVDCPEYFEEDIGFAGMVYDLRIEYIGMKCPTLCQTTYFAV